MPEDTIKSQLQTPPGAASKDLPARPQPEWPQSASQASPGVPSGVLAIDKPPGVSSASIVSRVKRLLPRKTKVGHAGTLDSFATGVLLILVGRATRQCEALMSSPKEYEATLRFGATTQTDDPMSPPRPVTVDVPPTREDVSAALQRQVGTILQMPPTYSALKVGGRRASDRARAGETVALQPRPVRIDAITLLDYDWPDARIHVACGRGTYVRAIARDAGEALGVGGYLTQLARTRVGDFTQSKSVSVEALSADNVHLYLIVS